MSDHSKIEWTEATWNPTTGCSKVSQGCKNCYALRDWARLSANPKSVYYGREFTDVQYHDERLDQPLRWRKPRRIFVNSMSDLFHEDVPVGFVDKVFMTMAVAYQHTFQVLTKRPERMREYLTGQSEHETEHPLKRIRALAELWHYERGRWVAPDRITWPLPNVWLGVSVEDQATADERIPLLLETPAAVRWISAEPLLGPVNLRNVDAAAGSTELCQVDALGGRHTDMGRPCPDTPRLDWVVAGGESGPKARPSHPDWFRDLRDQCTDAGVAWLFKQWGEWSPGAWRSETLARECATVGNTLMYRIGKKAAGRELDGRTWDEYPA